VTQYPRFEIFPGTAGEELERIKKSVVSSRVLPRILEHDYTLWRPEPDEIANRLGWLHSVNAMKEQTGRLREIADGIRRDGLTHVLLLGMGGSSLAAEVFRNTFGISEGCLDLSVLDSTVPETIAEFAGKLDPERTLYLVSTKSGGTIETASLFKFFYNRTRDALGEAKTGGHFIAITDPGSSLEDTARRLGFRETLLNDPDIGGRFSALSFFGLAPAAFLGIDLDRLLERAEGVIPRPGVEKGGKAGIEPSILAGAFLGKAARLGRDKATFVISQEISGFGDWVEQLIAESTGKNQTGILPVIGESPLSPDGYGDDRIFINLRMDGDASNDSLVDSLIASGFPVIRLNMEDIHDIGGLFFFWEMATAAAGFQLGINPFDQPDVEAAKVQAGKMTSEYSATGSLPEGEEEEPSPERLAEFLKNAGPASYVAIQAYLHETRETDRALDILRAEITGITGNPVTVGYGPRYLHSTGQLHKGDAGRGLFIQLVADEKIDLEIPDEPGSSSSSISFGILKAAQALGDAKALSEAGRPVIRFFLGTGNARGILRLVRTS